MAKTLSLILGGGRGTRLEPLTRQRSKPAVPIGGKYRLVDIPISNCLHSNIRQIFVLTQYNSASLNRHIKNTYQFDLFSPGFIDILAAEQTPGSQNWYQGTADAVRQSMHHMENLDFEQVLILSGDQLYQMDFEEMVKRYNDTNADVTIATIPVNAQDATGFGIMKTNEEHKITNFFEKPGLDELNGLESEVGEDLMNEGRVYLASMGIYIFNRDSLYDLIQKNPDATDFGRDIIPKAIEENYNVVSYKYDGYWTDIGTIKSFYEANLELTGELPRFDLYNRDKLIFTRARLLPGSKISGTTFERSIIAEGSIVEASRIQNSIIGIRARIGSDSVVKESIIMGNDYYPEFEEIQREDGPPILGIGERCHIEKAIIDKNCQIGNDVRIKGGDHLEDQHNENYSVVDGIVVVPKDSIIEDNVQIF